SRRLCHDARGPPAPHLRGLRSGGALVAGPDRSGPSGPPRRALGASSPPARGDRRGDDRSPPRALASRAGAGRVPVIETLERTSMVGGRKIAAATMIMGIASWLAAAAGHERGSSPRETLLYTRADLTEALTGQVEIRRAYGRELRLPLPRCAEGSWVCF